MDAISDEKPSLSAASDGRRRFIIVANRTGGQGKTLLSHLLAVCLRRVDPAFRVMCADSLEIVGSRRAGVSKLGRAVPNVIEIGSGPSLVDVQANPDVALEFWDAIGAPLLDQSEAGCVLDVGANVVDAILAWSRAADLDAVFAGTVVTDLVVPVTATAKSLSDARDIVSVALGSGGLPLRAVTVVENAWQGPFQAFAGQSDYKALISAAKESGGGVVSMPRCRSPQMLAEIERAHLSIADVLDWDFNRVASEFNWALIKANREAHSFASWYRETVESLAAAGLADPAPPSEARDHQGGRVRDARPR